jgi:hypothetical protein
MIAGAFNEYGDFVMPLDTSDDTNAPGEIEVVGDLGRADEPIALLRLTYSGEDQTTTVDLPAYGSIEIKQTQIRACAILTREQALALAAALTYLVRPTGEPE